VVRSTLEQQRIAIVSPVLSSTALAHHGEIGRRVILAGSALFLVEGVELPMHPALAPLPPPPQRLLRLSRLS
jgi:hypothetical protein